MASQGERSQHRSNRFFRAVWYAASLEGLCDAAFGKEFHRVRKEWYAAGRPDALLSFIRDTTRLFPAASGDGRLP
jgi:hypothetical protein